MMRSAAILLICVGFVGAGPNKYPITWYWHQNSQAEVVRQRYPWIRSIAERVNIEISHDGGASYTLLASGVPSDYGNNTWMYTVPDHPSSLSTNARVRVQSLPMYGREHTVDARAISISGLYFVDPPATVTNGADVTLKWVSAGTGGMVQLGTRVIGADTWVPQAVFNSQDSNQGAYTNTAVWSVTGLQSLPTEIILQSLAEPLCYRRHTLEVQ
jgi:hypothetical protein